MTFKPVPFRASSLGNPLSTTAVRLVALLLQLDEAPILLSMPKMKRILLVTLHNVKEHCLKITQNVAFKIFILAFSTNFCPFKTDLSGNTV